NLSLFADRLIGAWTESLVETAAGEYFVAKGSPVRTHEGLARAYGGRAIVWQLPGLDECGGVIGPHPRRRQAMLRIDVYRPPEEPPACRARGRRGVCHKPIRGNAHIVVR